MAEFAQANTRTKTLLGGTDRTPRLGRRRTDAARAVAELFAGLTKMAPMVRKCSKSGAIGGGHPDACSRRRLSGCSEYFRYSTHGLGTVPARDALGRFRAAACPRRKSNRGIHCGCGRAQLGGLATPLYLSRSRRP